jgi:nickel-dependent lactate racemase
MPLLNYGIDSSIQLEFSEGTQHRQCGTPRAKPLDDLARAVAGALEDPLDYPPLRQSTTPGDRVVLALGRGVPQSSQITAAVVHALIEAGVHPDGISVLRTEADVDEGAENPCRMLNAKLGERIRLLTHDPSNRGRMAYLAATEHGAPILLNRVLTDADLVLPIGCLRAEKSTGYYGIHTPVFPSFSDGQTQLRFRRHDLNRGEGHRHRDLIHEVDEVAWLLGLNFTIQVVPGAGDEVLHVVAGQSDAVRRHGRELYREAWTCPVPQRAGLVVAAIEGGIQHQTWENLGRSLAAAVPLVEEGGAIAVCCDLAADPGPAMQRLVGALSRQDVVRQIRREGPVDAVPAVQLARALEFDHVYLLSQLAPSLVEELDMTPLAGPDELCRLASKHKSCILLSNAPRAMVTVAEAE